MTPTSHAALKALGLTIEDFSRLTGPAVPTISYYGRERDGRLQPEPKWVQLLLTAWQRDPGAIPTE